MVSQDPANPSVTLVSTSRARASSSASSFSSWASAASLLARDNSSKDPTSILAFLRCALGPKVSLNGSVSTICERYRSLSTVRPRQTHRLLSLVLPQAKPSRELAIIAASQALANQAASWLASFPHQPSKIGLADENSGADGSAPSPPTGSFPTSLAPQLPHLTCDQACKPAFGLAWQA